MELRLLLFRFLELGKLIGKMSTGYGELFVEGLDKLDICFANT